MTDWDGAEYRQVSGLQQWLAGRVLEGLDLGAARRVLDVGCGDGRVTARIRAALPEGEVVGIDPSPRMVEVAAALVPTGDPGLRFAVGDVLTMSFADEFDLVVSFNALHWVLDQARALARIAAAVRPGGRALLVLVCAGPRRSLEQVAMDVAATPRWAASFTGFTAPFRHVEPERFATVAAAAGLDAVAADVEDLSWDFGSVPAFTRWCRVGFGAWTGRLPAGAADAFVADVVGAYERVADTPGMFRFRQLRTSLVVRP